MLIFLTFSKFIYLLDFTLEGFMEKECFFEDINEESRFEIQYNVIKGGFLDVDFQVF